MVTRPNWLAPFHIERAMTDLAAWLPCHRQGRPVADDSKGVASSHRCQGAFELLRGVGWVGRGGDQARPAARTARSSASASHTLATIMSRISSSVSDTPL